MATINLGRVGFVQKGTYSGSTAYKVNDVVVYNNGVYACISPTTGNLPTNTSYWKLWLDTSTLVAKTGDETITGVKTFSSNTIFNGNVGIGRIPYTSTAFVVKGVDSGSGYYSGYFENSVGTPLLAIRNDGFVTTKSLIVDSPTFGLGYGTGSGGTVTQLTSKGTSVTLNKPTGEIITSNEALVSGGETVFIVNNSLVTTRDAITVNPSSTNKYTTVCQGVFSGGFYVRIKNVTGGSLSESFSINFDITKGVNA